MTGDILDSIGSWLGAAWEIVATVLGALWHHLAALPLSHTLLVALLAMSLEFLIGWPRVLQAIIGHPVQWMGAMIARFDRRLNRPKRGARARFLAGLLMMAGLILFWGGLSWAIATALRNAWPDQAHWLEALLAAPWLAAKSLRQHVRAVRDALAAHPGDLQPARMEVAKIVGRDVAAYDESGIVRAAVESLAENTSDGVIAPAFWLALLGLPGIIVYKLVNTADSMIGHRNDQYRHFGKAAAKLDDVMNWLPARLTGWLYALAPAFFFNLHAGMRALHIMRRDARLHVSPNAGWPEAAMAGALDIRLGGPRAYAGRLVELPWLGDGREGLTRDDITAALTLYHKLLFIAWVLLIFLWAFLPANGIT